MRTLAAANESVIDCELETKEVDVLRTSGLIQETKLAYIAIPHWLAYLLTAASLFSVSRASSSKELKLESIVLILVHYFSPSWSTIRYCPRPTCTPDINFPGFRETSCV